MSDVDDFFAEQDDRMNIPDENLEDYVARMGPVMNRDIRLPQAMRMTHASERETEDQARASSSKRCKLNSESNSTAPERTSHEGTSVLKRRQTESDSTDAPVVKKHKQIHTANSNPVGEQTAFKSNDIAHNPASAGPVRIRSKQPTSTAKRSTDDYKDLSNSASVECATSAHNSVHAPAMYSSNQRLRHSQLDAVPVPSPGASKPPSSPSIMNDQMGQSNPKLPEPRPNQAHRRSKPNVALRANSVTTQELLSQPTYKMPNHTDANEYRQPISTTPANVSLASNATAIQPYQASSTAPLTLNPSRVTSSSHLEAPTTKHMRDNVDPSPVKSHSIGKPGRPSQGPSSATPISEFQPQATSTQLPETSAGPVSVQKKVANFSRSKVTPKRDRVLKLTPKHKAETDISNITTPNATGVSISTAPDAGVSSSVPSRADVSNTKSMVAKDKKLTTSRNKKKEKELVTPLAYAQILCNKLDVLAKKTDFLKGKRLFYTGGDMQYASQSTKKKMELIIQYGGVLAPNFDPEHVTHIITDAAERPTLRALGLKSLKDVAPHTPIVTWSWITEGRGRAGLTEKEHAAFPSHIVDTVGRAKVENESSGELSRISQFTQDDPRAAPSAHLSMASVSRPVSPHDNINPLKSLTDPAASTSFPAHVSEPRDPNDPLAEFYELAKAERDNDVSEYDDDVGDRDVSEDGETDDEYHGEAGPPIKRGFTCDSKVSRSEGSKNQDIIEKLQELMELHKSKPSKDDFWRGFSYSKAIGPIRNHPRRIRSYAEARSIRGVGDKTAEKIMEIIQTGGLRRIAFENTGDVEAAKIFTGIYGVGQTIAYRWYASGCRTLDDVRAGKGGVKLTPAMEIGLRFYDDINSRMPRGEAEEIFNLIKPIALSLDPRLFIDIMGSFRRGKKDCGDIDIMITRPTDDKKTHAGIVPHLLHALREAGIVTEDLALPDDSHSTEAIYRGLCKLPDTVDEEGKFVRRLRRRIDILSIPWENRGAALLYYTGDDIFNRAMRFKANKMGYSLNQRGLFQGVVRDPHDRRIKTNTGNIIASETEEEIFKILGVPWQEPHERVRSQ